MKFCPECGAPQTTTPGMVQPKENMFGSNPAVARTKRPKEVSFLIIFDTIAGIALLVIGILAYFAGNGSVSNYGLLLAFVGIMSIVIAYGTSRVESWVRLPGIAVGAVMIILGLLLGPGGYILGLPVLLVGGWTVYTLTRPKVKEYLTS